MITLIDYGGGNLKSVENAFLKLGEQVKISNQKEEILKAKALVLPGVGSFESCMNELQKLDLIDAIVTQIENKTPYLGICLGMQILFESSEEVMENNETATTKREAKGLGVLKGKIKRFPTLQGLKIPHIGWNTVVQNKQSKSFRGIEDETYFYYVHSYYLKAEDRRIVSGTTSYGIDIDGAIEFDNIMGFQFHPEKSSDEGLKVLSNFIEFVKEFAIEK